MARNAGARPADKGGYEAAFQLYKTLERTTDPGNREKLLTELRAIAASLPRTSSDPASSFVPYPTLDDPRFNEKLLVKHEFSRFRSSIQDVERSCQPGAFQLSNVQKFLRNLISPYTPYTSILIMHGVGVGKTKTAIHIAEAFEDVFTKPALVIGPPALRGNFFNQVASPDAASASCTQNHASKRAISQSDFVYLGYVKFAGRIEHWQATLTPEAFVRKVADTYSDRVVIIDEVQNLRKVQNKKKGVSLRIVQLLTHAKNVRLVLLTATPLYNDAEELTFIMELCYMNDRNQAAINRIRASRFLKSGGDLTPSDVEILSAFSKRYVSYMRGENPYAFPQRLYPSTTTPFDELPRLDASGKAIPRNGRIRYTPVVASELSPAQAAYFAQVYSSTDVNELASPEQKGGSSGDSANASSRGRPSVQLDVQDDEDLNPMLMRMIEAGNIVYPEGMLGGEGFYACVRSLKGGIGAGRFAYNEHARREHGDIFHPSNIGAYSPKIKTIMEKIMRSEGVVIVYSRFLPSGLLPLAFALEHAGVVNVRGNLMRIERPATGESPRTATPQRYAIIAGAGEVASGVDKIMNMVNQPENADGRLVKFVLISVKAAEGFDFKYVRELHVMEPWYNLSRIEQIIGRGVRNCSHALLPAEKRNCTIFHHITVFPGAGKPTRAAPKAIGDGKHGRVPDVSGRETVDVLLYRLAEGKQIFNSKVERVMKQNALDCHLHRTVLSFPQSTFPPQKMVNSQGEIAMVRRGDVDHSRACDFAKCEFECRGTRPDFEAAPDASTMDDFFVQKDADVYARELAVLFESRASMTRADAKKLLQKRMPVVNDEILNLALSRIVDAKACAVYKGVPGTVIYRSNVYAFQPSAIDDPKLTQRERAMIHDSLRARSVSNRIELRKEEVAATADRRRGASVLDRVAALHKIYGDSFAQRVLVDYVVDHLTDDELVPAAVAAIRAGGPVRESMQDGGILAGGIQNTTSVVIFDPYTRTYHDASGKPYTSYISKRLEIVHNEATRKRVSGRHRLPTFINLKNGRPVFKMIYKKEKDEAALTGVVCTAFPQLRKEELASIIQKLGVNVGVAPTRPQLCEIYELAMRRENMVARPIEVIATS
jgi:hypothetical protein